MVYIRRVYFSKKHQIIFFIATSLFMAYYIIFHLGATWRTSDLDFTRQIHGLQSFNASINNSLDDYSIAPTTTQASKQTKPNIITHRKSTARKLTKTSKLNNNNGLQDIHNRESIIVYIEKTLQESLKEDKGTGCDIPKLDPFAPEIMKFDKKQPTIVCTSHDWVKCYMGKCEVDPKLLETVKDEIECSYRDIIFVSDSKYYLGVPVILKGNQEYILDKSDHVKIKCKLTSNVVNSYLGSSSWTGVGIGYRPLKPEKPPPDRENTLNILIFGFDSTSKNGFIRKMPESYKFLTEELGAVVLNGYNILGDGTPAALFPILTGKTELELPESRKTIRNSGHLDDMPFIFFTLKQDGYRTAYFEDSPSIGTFQYRFNGFRHQPADHYLRAFYLEEAKTPGKGNLAGYCVGDTPRFKLMMNITDQFFRLDGKRFCFTFVADITHNDFNFITNADRPFVDFLTLMQKEGRFEDTMLVVMGDHGPRYADVRGTLQGKMEERLPLMAIRLPEKLTSKRPEALKHLQSNAERLTTAHDLHATIYDVLDMRENWNLYKVTGADLPRGMTLLEPVPKNRSCSEAGIEAHWCTCLKWETVTPDDPLYQRTAQALVDHINQITEFQRTKCALRTLTSIDWVTKKRANTKMLEFKEARDNDGYVGKFGPAIKLNKDIYQVKISVGPGLGAYEAAVTHNLDEDKLYINTREISRINAYNDEPACISDVYPHLNMYCYCNT